MLPIEYRWAHGLNSNASLTNVVHQIQAAKHHQFATPDYVNAIEADIIWSETQQKPVMGHPPAIDGDLTLARFLTAMLDLASTFQSFVPTCKTPLIVKCDFKSRRAFEASLGLLTAFTTHFPFAKGVFINADILPGPANSDNVAFDAEWFLKQVHDLSECDGGQHRHKLVLSIGWTTANGTEEEINREYLPKMVDDMLRLLQPYGASLAVTFPVRATSVRTSWSALRPLLGPDNHGLTLWWTKTQMADDELEWIFTTLELSRDNDSMDERPTYAGRTFYDIRGFDAFLAKRKDIMAKMQN